MHAIPLEDVNVRVSFIISILFAAVIKEWPDDIRKIEGIQVELKQKLGPDGEFWIERLYGERDEEDGTDE